MHSTSWQAVCGFFTDIYETLERDDISMRHIFEVICQYPNNKYALWMENGKKRQLLYSELPGYCAGAAHAISICCPEPSGVIAFHMANSPMWPVIFWAILMSGHVPLMLNASLPLETFDGVIKDAGAVAVISSEDKPGVIHPDALIAKRGQADMALFENRWEDRMIFMTSGTSGAPKLLVYNGKSIACQIQSCRYFYRDTTELAYPKCNGFTRQLALLPFSHIFGFVICVIWYPFFGDQIVYPETLRPDKVIAACQKFDVTHFCAVPSYFELLAVIFEKASRRLFGKQAEGYITYLKEGRLPSPELYQRYQSFNKRLRARTVGSHIRYMISGGGMLATSTAALFNRLGLHFCNGYGMTELGILCVEQSSAAEKRAQAAVGKPSYGVEFILDEKGELYVNCRFAAVGYWENGDITPLPQPFRTRDRARMLPDGRYVLLGRNDDIIIDNDGNRIHPSEIEDRLRAISGITAVCVFSNGNRLVALFEAAAGNCSTDDIGAGINSANSCAPISQCVREAWLCSDRLPRSSKGDINRKKVAELYRESIGDMSDIPINQDIAGTELSPELVASLRKKIAELLSLSVDQVQPDANFFTELGLDSLAYMCLVQWLDEKYGSTAAGENRPRLESVNQCVDWIQRNGGCTK